MQTIFTTNPIVHISKLTSPFLNFISQFNIIPLAFSLIISLNLNQLSNTFISAIIAPIINKLVNNDKENLKDQTVTIGGITFQYGLFLLNLIQFIFILLTLYFIYEIYRYIAHEELKVTLSK